MTATETCADCSAILTWPRFHRDALGNVYCRDCRARRLTRTKATPDSPPTKPATRQTPSRRRKPSP